MNFRHLFLLSSVCLLSCSNNPGGVIANQQPGASLVPLALYSAAFKEGEPIPAIYTCDSTNISPPLHWNNPLKNTVSFALIMDDPDAPLATWVHWLVYNIPDADTILNAAVPKNDTLANGAKQGTSSFKETGYGGPCPPNGTHHYHFKLYALDIMLTSPAGLTKNKLMDSMKGHILAEAELIGTYKRIKN